MLIVESYPVAVLMCVITMLCWGSWANTQKLASKEWRFQLFYWDYAIGVFLLSLILAFTMGSTGSGGRGFLADLQQADAKWLWLGLSGRRHLQPVEHPAGGGHRHRRAGGGVSGRRRPGAGAGRDHHLPVHQGRQRADAGGSAWRRSWWPSSSTPWPTSAWPAAARKRRSKGIVISVAAGLLMGFFYSYVAQAMGKIDPVNASSLEAGKLSPYTAVVLFSAGLLLSNFVWNSIMMVKPFTGEPVPFGDYFTKGNVRLHLVGILGGMIWNVGMAFSIIASTKAGAALSYGLGPGRHDDRRVLGRVHLEGVQRRAAGHQQAPGGHVPASTCSGLGHPDRVETLSARSRRLHDPIAL